MKEFKGTPGPWELNYVTYVTDSSGNHLCEVLGDKTDLDEDLSNAKLIAAAPELLSALQDVIKSLEITLRVGYERIIDLGGECDIPEVMIKGHSEIARAKAAIAKALGE